jgi:DNA-binding transcriptional ArsR family regulator
VSRHLRILRDAGIVTSRTEGQRRISSLCPEPFEELCAWLEDYRLLWEARLDNVEIALERRKAARGNQEMQGEK